MRKALLSVLLTIFILVAFVGGSLSVAAEKRDSKIDSELLSILETSDPNEQIPVLIWFTGIDRSEPVTVALNAAMAKMETKPVVSTIPLPASS